MKNFKDRYDRHFGDSISTFQLKDGTEYIYATQKGILDMVGYLNSTNVRSHVAEIIIKKAAELIRGDILKIDSCYSEWPSSVEQLIVDPVLPESLVSFVNWKEHFASSYLFAMILFSMPPEEKPKQLSIQLLTCALNENLVPGML